MVMGEEAKNRWLTENLTTEHMHWRSLLPPPSILAYERPNMDLSGKREGSFLRRLSQLITED